VKRELIHCSYHKCLTVYFGRVFSSLYNRVFRIGGGYRHFNSRIDEFYREHGECRVSSINNHALDFDKLRGDFRITRFVRDPRDLVVSGYFYHKRGAEPWCKVVDPKEEDWRVVNGCIPERLEKGQSFSSHLESLSKEEGLIAEMEFRRAHFESMAEWPEADPRVKLFRYEDTIGNEQKVFGEVLAHYGLSWPERKIGTIFADRFSAAKQGSRKTHIRDPKAGQWRGHFSPKAAEYFEQHYGQLLQRYGYE